MGVPNHIKYPVLAIILWVIVMSVGKVILGSVTETSAIIVFIAIVMMVSIEFIERLSIKIVETTIYEKKQKLNKKQCYE